ncbi:MAG: FAD-dependent oxidoreductase, partial [Pseudomonadota bacterium]
ALLNPRQSTPVEYVGSALNLKADSSALLRAGMPAPEARLRGPAGNVHLSTCFGRAFVLLCFSGSVLPAELLELANDAGNSPASVRVIQISSQGQPGRNTLVDELGQAHSRYGANEGSIYLVRPDAYLMGCWKNADAATIASVLKPFQQPTLLACAA